MANITALPNPYTPLAFLPPTLANQLEVSRYMYAVTLGAYAWDLATNIGNDYKLLFHYKVNFPTVVYFLSRIFTLSYILTSFIFQVGSVPNCQALQVAFGVCMALSQSTTAILFLLRVLAVWHGNKLIRGVFIFLWFAVAVASTTIAFGTKGAHIGPTQQCINVQVAGYIESTLIMALINDSTVLTAISYRILRNCVLEDSFKARVRTFVGGGGSIPHLSKALLRGGQHYYLIAVCGNIVILVLLKDPSVPAVYHAMCSVPIFALINAMGCIVFRNIKFGHISADGAAYIPSTDQSRSYPNRPTGNSLPLHVRSAYHQDGDVFTRNINVTEVKVSQVVELDPDYERNRLSLSKGPQYDEST
ncbi:hypothetical protein DEU56DRAFT_137488 [Suillus clintonianus]|uniref:uncharacterized protein n=1 Tax=Suillus clintonianus TaxID=1904413 RepID=UPI001B86980F|nr:uncharacterized protein DEU56DRAFT_137488 [Suillus clintonianus]KAG2119202.1 hypothetical protein DEU56DRAFT_137488 [Suillus clintonianus]